jgi:Lon protease-like protein
MSSSVTLPKQLPVMPLPGAVLFPHALLPLYIFEPRYCHMLEHALQHHRMFCVTLIKPSCPAWHAREDFFQLATVGLIRACVGHGDGTSNLILQGLQRVRFSSFEQETPFPIAGIDVVESSRDATTVETEALGAKVLELYANLKHDGRQLPAKVDRYLAELRDLEMLADLMASTFVNDPLRRQRVLEEHSLNERLRFLIRYLRDEIGNAAA